MNILWVKNSQNRYYIDIGNSIKFRGFKREDVLEVLQLFIKLSERDRPGHIYPEKLCGWDLSVSYVNYHTLTTEISNNHHTYFETFTREDIAEVVSKLLEATKECSQYAENAHYRMYHDSLELASKYNEKSLEEILAFANTFNSCPTKDKDGLNSEDFYNWHALMKIYYRKRVEIAQEEESNFTKFTYQVMNSIA